MIPTYTRPGPSDEWERGASDGKKRFLAVNAGRCPRSRTEVYALGHYAGTIWCWPTVRSCCCSAFNGSGDAMKIADNKAPGSRASRFGMNSLVAKFSPADWESMCPGLRVPARQLFTFMLTELFGFGQENRFLTPDLPMPSIPPFAHGRKVQDMGRDYSA